MLRLSAVGGALCLAALGCGYRFSSRRASLPEGVRSVCAPVFRNETAEPAVEALFTQSFREELVRAGTLGASACEARVEGVVRELTSGPFAPAEPAFPGTQGAATPQAATWRTSATVELRLMQDGRVLAEATVAGSEDFFPGNGSGDVLQVEANRQAALQRLAESLMREGYERLATGW